MHAYIYTIYITLPSFLQVHGSFWAANESAALEVFCGGAEGEWAGERLQ